MWHSFIVGCCWCWYLMGFFLCCNFWTNGTLEFKINLGCTFLETAWRPNVHWKECDFVRPRWTTRLCSRFYNYIHDFNNLKVISKRVYNWYISSIFTEYPAILNNISRAVGLVYNCERNLIHNDIISPSRTNIIELEKHLLDLSANIEATQGIFYMLVIGTGERQFVRFLESGSYAGFYHSNRGSENFPPFVTGPGYRIYSDKDIQQRRDQKRSTTGSCEGNKTSKFYFFVTLQHWTGASEWCPWKFVVPNHQPPPPPPLSLSILTMKQGS